MPGRRIREWRYSSTHLLTLALDGGEHSEEPSVNGMILLERILGK